MIFQTTLLLILGSVLAIISEAANSTVARSNSTKGCVPAVSTKWSEDVLNGACIPYQAKFPNGICKDILGYQPVYGTSLNELEGKEYGRRNYQLAKTLVKQERVNSFGNETVDDFFTARERCEKMDDDVSCYEWFKRCYISSSPQLLCREICEELAFNVCKREYKLHEELNKAQRDSGYPYTYIIRDCTALPFRNESPNCYYPDEIRDQLNVLESKECFYGDGRGYRGNRSVTASGYTCQSWNAQCPHQHDIINGKIYKELSGNLCRNPGGYALNGPWCYTTNRSVRWESCGVPKCAEQPPSSPPVNFRGHNTSSTSIKLTWGDVPSDLIHGILLGFYIVCERTRNVSDRHFEALVPTKHNWTFGGLHKYTNYTCRLRAYNNFGTGNWSEELVISTDEDVPSSAPENLKVRNKTSTRIHVEWDPIPLEYQHGQILRYKVEITAEEQKRQRSKRRVANYKYTESRSLAFNRLKKCSKYVVSVSGLTRIGEGPARPLTVQVDDDGETDEIRKPNHSKDTSQIVNIVLAAVLPGIVALGAVFLVVHFVRKGRVSPNQFHKGNDCTVVPYAVSSPDWIDRIVNSHWQWNEMPDNVPTTTRQPSYINIAADGSLNLPPHMRYIVNEFERRYENTHYKRLQPCGTRRSLEGAVDGHGNPVYDRLLRGICLTASSQGRTVAPEKERKKRHSVGLGELRRFIGDLQIDVFHGEMKEMGTRKQRRKRPFSIDLGQIKEFAAIREITSTKEKSTATADQPECHKAIC